MTTKNRLAVLMGSVALSFTEVFGFIQLDYAQGLRTDSMLPPRTNLNNQDLKGAPLEKTVPHETLETQQVVIESLARDLKELKEKEASLNTRENILRDQTLLLEKLVKDLSDLDRPDVRDILRRYGLFIPETTLMAPPMLEGTVLPPPPPPMPQGKVLPPPMPTGKKVTPLAPPPGGSLKPTPKKRPQEKPLTVQEELRNRIQSGQTLRQTQADTAQRPAAFQRVLFAPGTPEERMEQSVEKAIETVAAIRNLIPAQSIKDIANRAAQATSGQGTGIRINKAAESVLEAIGRKGNIPLMGSLIAAIKKANDPTLKGMTGDYDPRAENLPPVIVPPGDAQTIAEALREQQPKLGITPRDADEIAVILSQLPADTTRKQKIQKGLELITDRSRYGKDAKSSLKDFRFLAQLTLSKVLR